MMGDVKESLPTGDALADALLKLARKYDLDAALVATLNRAAAALRSRQQVADCVAKDAERYRWLTSSKPIHDGSPFVARNFGGSFSMWTGEDADRVIDAAILAAKEPHP